MLFVAFTSCVFFKQTANKEYPPKQLLASPWLSLDLVSFITSGLFHAMQSKAGSTQLHGLDQRDGLYRCTPDAGSRAVGPLNSNCPEFVDPALGAGQTLAHAERTQICHASCTADVILQNSVSCAYMDVYNLYVCMQASKHACMYI